MNVLASGHSGRRLDFSLDGNTGEVFIGQLETMQPDIKDPG
jgi:hypothetical protein